MGTDPRKEVPGFGKTRGRSVCGSVRPVRKFPFVEMLPGGRKVLPGRIMAHAFSHPDAGTGEPSQTNPLWGSVENRKDRVVRHKGEAFAGGTQVCREGVELPAG